MSRKRRTAYEKQASATIAFTRDLLALAKAAGVRSMRAGDFFCTFGRNPKELPDAIGFEVPAEGEREFEPEETRRRKRRRGA